MLKTQRFALVLTVINLVILLFMVTYTRSVTAQEIPTVLRGRSLEIVDSQGKVRAQIIITSPTTMPDGQSYPETVLFRLIDSNGRPDVKIGGSVDGSGISLAGDSEKREWSGVQILADGKASTVKLTNKDGSQQIVTP